VVTRWARNGEAALRTASQRTAERRSTACGVEGGEAGAGACVGVGVEVDVLVAEPLDEVDVRLGVRRERIRTGNGWRELPLHPPWRQRVDRAPSRARSLGALGVCAGAVVQLEAWVVVHDEVHALAT
jgi:hypothetical protein